MLEVQSVIDAGNYAYKRETAHKGENQTTGFSELMHGENEILKNSSPVAHGFEKNEEEMLFNDNVEVVTYTLSGEISLFRKLTGRIIDIEV